ncbi:ABC transporter, solute-binding protein [Corynebacterium genitalium ATCC 33030]|uniref:ABC transporter, solute-binding protein n=2 Tax=Corynebacteriaceae TaxID=1653 RepID=D7WAE1_9CORY|nr:ABC transporter, solute-binding protein [Corynebacterium genitalium ATCC 33030]
MERLYMFFTKKSAAARVAAASFAVATTLGLAACGGGGDDGASANVGGSPEEIAQLAKEEGEVRLIAYPKTWANYEGHFNEFTSKYDVKVAVDSPDASSAEELQAVQNLKGQDSQPDVLDIGYSFTNPAIDQGLVEPFKPSTFDEIPDDFKDPEGKWVSAYYGVIEFGVNTKKVDDVPKTFKDLLDPKYKGQIALSGDPRQGASSIAGVFAASLANGGSLDDIEPGVAFFEELSKSGNLVSISDPAAALTTGEAAIVLDWNYNWVGATEQLEKDGVDLERVVPEDGVFGNFYAQPISVNPKRPNAARLWVEWLNSDEGAEQYALGGAIPSRFTKLAEEGKLSDEAMEKLPDPAVLEKVQVPSVEQGDKANEVIATEWAKRVRN